MLEPWQKLDCNSKVEAVELYNYISNEFRFYSRLTAMFRKFETEAKWKTFIPEYCEARLFEIAHDAAQGYCREYCGRETRYLDVFELDTIKNCAKLMAREFMIETEAGNSWL